MKDDRQKGGLQVELIRAGGMFVGWKNLNNVHIDIIPANLATV